MQALIEVILPVFLVIGYGYIARRQGWVSDELVDNVMKFAQNFAVPLLLFSGIAKMDLAQNFHPPILISFYAGALSGGLFCFLGARYLFGRDLTDAVAIGFIGLFSNSLLLGIPITERAYGEAALAGNFAIISIHSPLLYGIGIAAMEIARTRGLGLSGFGLMRQIARSVLRNPLILGISAGWIVNLTQITLPVPVWDAVSLMSRAAIPAALFGLGGVLLRYKPEGDMRIIAWAVFASLVLHPAIAYGLAHFGFGLDIGSLRSATLTAAMAPGVNAYLFANMYGVAKRVAASSVLLGTGLSILSIWCWLAILP
ncbi:AEC family transporter [Celeribacter halophilus]|jgi:predicted permease|uniref:AEC family transporter n=1 Tax=Celeribacter halophilus TaxID=576117 RepID=A0AAW7XYF5_9RHOB|nr:AEC family transporter [Celeribacter halophilus]MDO6458716.1 AEC family transporter [Celeribacter halophilus]MDO6722470.1 AEC family transporter [Celeribacter halophilus]